MQFVIIWQIFLANIPNFQILVFSSIWVKSHYLGYFENFKFYPNLLSFTKTPSLVVACVVLHHFLREHQNSDEIFSEY